MRRAAPRVARGVAPEVDSFNSSDSHFVVVHVARAKT